MSMCGKNHYNTVISLQLIKINGKKKRNNNDTECLLGAVIVLRALHKLISFNLHHMHMNFL